MSSKGFIPPQFHSDDLPIWRAWEPTAINKYIDIEYSVRLAGQDPGPGEDKKWGGMWKKLTARRVDAVGYTDVDVDLIEFRAFAGPSSIGQLLIYRTLWKLERGNSKKINLILVSDLLTDHMVVTALDNNIKIIIVKPK